MVSQLEALPSLKELVIVKGYVDSSALEGAGLDPRVAAESPGAFERLLHCLKTLPKLQSLRVAAVNDDISLSRCLFSLIAFLHT